MFHRVRGHGCVLASLLVVGCGSVGNEKQDAAAGMDTKMADAAPDAPAAKRCDKTKPFGAPVHEDVLSTPANEAYVSLTPDEKTAYIGSATTNTIGSVDLWVTTRASTSDPWGPLTNLTTLNTTAVEYKGVVSPDQLTIYFDSSRGSDGRYDIYVATRSTIAGDFGGVTAVSNINMAGGVTDGSPWISPDGLDLYFQSTRGVGDYNLYHSTRANTSSPFGAPVEIGELNTTFNEDDFTLTPDQLAIYFASNRTGANYEVYVARRSTKADGFGTPTLLTELTAPEQDWATWVSADECVLYMGSDRTGSEGSHDIWVATRPL